MRRTNLEIERHASNLYTRAMFEQFGERLFEATAYKVTELEKGRRYLTTYNNASKRERWSRVVYEVMIKDEGSEFECECGHFEYTGMLCCHVLRGGQWRVVHYVREFTGLYLRSSLSRVRLR